MLSLMLSDQVYQWYVLGWANMLVRKFKGGWQNVRVGQHIRTDSDGSGATSWLTVTSVTHADTIPELVNKYNYMQIYPRPTGVGNTCMYIGRMIHGTYTDTTHVEGGYVLVGVELASILEASESELDQTSGSTKIDFPHHKYPM